MRVETKVYGWTLGDALEHIRAAYAILEHGAKWQGSKRDFREAIEGLQVAHASVRGMAYRIGDEALALSMIDGRILLDEARSKLRNNDANSQRGSND